MSDGTFGGLHVGRIEWDDAGKLGFHKRHAPRVWFATKVRRLFSDVNDPTIKDGILARDDLRARDDTEFKFTTLYGKGVSIEPPLNKK